MTKEELDEKMKGVNFPEKLDSISTTEKKKNSFFSGAIFTESFRSNRKSLFIISFFNALIMVVIVLILSTLNMNATKRALNNMFSGADMESTLKMGALSHYLGFKQTSDAVVSFDSNYETSVSSLSDAISLADSTAMLTAVEGVTRAYDTAYSATANETTLTDAQRHENAKTVTMPAVNTVVNNANISSQEKEIATHTFNYVLDYHHADSTLSNKDLLIKAIPEGATDYVMKSVPSEKNTDETKTKVKGILDQAFYNTYSLNMRPVESATLATFDLIPIVIDSSNNTYSGNLSTITDKLREAYNSNTKETFLTSRSYRREIVANALVDIVSNYLQDFIYYSELPDFTVIYQTTKYGKPVYLQETNLVDDSGAQIYKELEADSYMPDKFIKLSDGMGINSNLLHKMNKEIITGEAYTQEEIQKAREASAGSISLIRDNIDEFLKKFISSSYFEDSSTFKLDNYVENAVVSKINSTAEDMIIEMYKERTGKEVSSASEIRANEISNMSGDDMLSQIDGYVVSAIATYNRLYNEAIDEQRSEQEATLSSVVHASQGVVDMLPSSVGGALTEMGTLNSYGFFVGILAMGIACVLVPLVYNILLANSLVVDKVQTGSLAFVLSTPTNRSTFIVTEALYLIFSQVVIYAVTLAGCLLSRTVGIWMGSEDLVESLVVKDLMLFALGNFAIIVTISSICFLTSCIFNKSKQSIGIGGGLNIFFFVATILGLFGTKIMPSFIRIEAMNIFNYMSIITLYDASAVMNGEYLKYTIKLLSLFLISGTCLFTGIRVFIKKDLPL